MCKCSLITFHFEGEVSDKDSVTEICRSKDGSCLQSPLGLPASHVPASSPLVWPPRCYPHPTATVDIAFSVGWSCLTGICKNSLVPVKFQLNHLLVLSLKNITWQIIKKSFGSVTSSCKHWGQKATCPWVLLPIFCAHLHQDPMEGADWMLSWWKLSLPQ